MQSTPLSNSDKHYARLIIEREAGSPLTKDVFRATTLIGSAIGCNIQLVSPLVAHAHTVITLEKNQFRLRDLRSVNGTLVNGQKVELTTLNDEDIISVGGLKFRFETNIYESMMSEQSDTQLELALHHEPSAATNLSHEYTTDEANRLRRGSAYARLKFTHASGSVGYKDILRNTTLLGSTPGANLQLIAEGIAPAHSLITLESEHLVLRDLRTKQGTFHNGKRIEVQELTDGDQILVGTFLFTLETNLSSEIDSLNSLTDTHLNVQTTSQQDELHAAEFPPTELTETTEIVIPPELIQDLSNSVAKEVHPVNETETTNIEEVTSKLQAKETELAELAKQLEQREAEIEQSETEIAQRKAEQVSIDQQLLKTAHDFREQYDQFQTEKQNHEKANRETQETTSRLNDLEAKLIARQTELDLAQAEVDQLRSELQIQVEKTEADRKSISEQETTLTQTSEELDKLKQAIEAEKQQLAVRAQNLEAQEAVLESSNVKFSEQQEVLQNAREHLAAQEQEQAEKAAQQNQQLADSKKQQEELFTQREKELTEQLNEIAQYKSELEEKTEQLNKQTEQISIRETELTESLSALTSQESALEENTQTHLQRERQHQEQVEQLDKLRRQYETDRQKLQQQLDTLSSSHAENTKQHAQFLKEQEHLTNWKQSLQQGLKALDKARVRYWKLLRLDARESVNDVSTAKSLLISGKITRFQAEWMINGKFPEFNIEQYKVQALLDTGGMGWLYRGTDTKTGKPVALKLLNRKTMSDKSLLTRFQLEAKAGMKIDHPNVIKTIEIGENENYDYLSTEFIEGVNLSEYRELTQRLPWEQACDFAMQTAQGLSAIHGAGMIHRDIKPSNLVIDDRGNVKILDFGLAMMCDEEDEFTLAMIYGHDCVGTADYIAPEQSQDSFHIGPEADLYSLGCALYLWLGGQVPFPVKPIREKLEGHRHKEPPALNSLVPDLPEKVIQVVEKLMKKEPAERYQTAEEVITDLKPFAKRQHCWFDYPAVLMVRSAEARARIRIQAKATANDMTNELPGSTNDVRRSEQSQTKNK